MGRLIKIHEIDEFNEIINIPDASISDEILTNVLNLDEEMELEQFTRDILYDPNNTPHGPVEIADILTTLCVRGEKKNTAFVLKGKSYKKVTSREVSHQFLKLRQLPDIGLIVFGAVGNIYDDAQRDFITTAMDIGCDYLIVDAHDWARLFIAYEKICPKDGLPYREHGICIAGHQRETRIKLEWETTDKARYTIVQHMDVSTGMAKRYSAIIRMDRHYSREVIRNIIQKATLEVKESTYYKNERTKERWGNTPAHVVWLYIAHDHEDIQTTNWVCRSSWIYPDLPATYRPVSLGGDEVVEGIEIKWNDGYKSFKGFVESHLGSKEEVIELAELLIGEMLPYATLAVEQYKKYQSKSIEKEEFIRCIKSLRPKVSQLYLKAGNMPIPPSECKDFSEECQNIYATIDNMYLYVTDDFDQGKEWLFTKAIIDLSKELQRLEFERRKFR
ncbi:hypothetical protein DFQ01_1034 [Paenibacillus cellulosilyticus]|uniref:Uncharacterized protein n=1 Tax=Paenibacillus cellulosilyticus TaxID=375489 RepID=A0A2V2YZ58_9BACL|nr:hypothetical protein [Paenibacillus cellulosilyticus]PWW06105.1 hypothetical protein DFQ01_1034 [Paenibacillus cellulosilyticus]QKS43119.1 hypothetical protein HUB94_01150 [Paenibacillus cellulosilyticus]